MLHPSILEEILDAEMGVAQERCGPRGATLERHRTAVHATWTTADHTVVTVAFDGAAYDAEPFRVDQVDANGQPQAPGQWHKQLLHSVHPVLNRPFICVRGTYEYHCHPSHLDDRWDLHRGSVRLGDLLAHLMIRTGL
jgi:Predicted metal binding domain